MNILTKDGYVDCLQFNNFRFLTSFKETIHCRTSYAPVAIITLLNGLRIPMPADLSIETNEGLVTVRDLKFGSRLIMHKDPANLDVLEKICNTVGKKRQINEDAWYIDFYIHSHEEILQLYLETGCCLKVRPMSDKYMVSVPSDILNLIEPEVINIDKIREPLEVVKDIRIVTDLCIKSDSYIDPWTKIVINECVCYNTKLSP